MKKTLKNTFVVLMVIVIMFMFLVLYTNDLIKNDCLEFTVPIFTNREKIELVSDNIFEDEEFEKIYLSKFQAERILRKIKSNSNWKYGTVDSSVYETIRFYSRDNIYDNIPQIDNGYWIFTNRDRKVKARHSIKEILDDGFYYSVAFALFDYENNILYYYDYDS